MSNNDDFEILFGEKKNQHKIIRVIGDDPSLLFDEFQRRFDQKFRERNMPKKNKVKKKDILDDNLRDILGEPSDFNL